jgi:hypothetical protein
MFIEKEVGLRRPPFSFASFYITILNQQVMFIHKEKVTLAASVETAFEYISTPANFPLWLKDVWIAGRIFGKMGLGCSMIQTIRLINPRKFNMRVTGFVENRYFRIHAIKGFMLLPGYVFSLKPLKTGHTELTVSVEFKRKWEAGEKNHLKAFGLVYPGGVAQHWKIYLELLEKEIIKKHQKNNRKARLK